MSYYLGLELAQIYCCASEKRKKKKKKNGESIVAVLLFQVLEYFELWKIFVFELKWFKSF